MKYVIASAFLNQRVVVAVAGVAPVYPGLVTDVNCDRLVLLEQGHERHIDLDKIAVITTRSDT